MPGRVVTNQFTTEDGRLITIPPTLLITADPEKGTIITPEVAHVVTEMNSNISEAHIPGPGHHIRFENYDTYVDAVKVFLKEIR